MRRLSVCLCYKKVQKWETALSDILKHTVEMLHDFTQKNAVFKKQTRTHLSTILPKQTMQCCHIVETATAGIIDIYIYGQHSACKHNIKTKTGDYCHLTAS